MTPPPSGWALATGEIEESQLADDVVRRDFTLYSSVSSTSAGLEKDSADVVVLGNSTDSLSPFPNRPRRDARPDRR